MNIQEEIRILNSSIELIENYVNYSICCFPEDRTKLVNSVLPQDTTAKKYFFILLLDVIAGVNKEIISSKKDGDNLLDLLLKISNSPQLDFNSNRTNELKASVESFIFWLDQVFKYEIYSAGIGKELTITLTRKDAIYLIGNRCKHSLLRSSTILKKLVGIYKASGTEVTPADEIMILEDIDNWLFDDFGGYHFTKLCELSAKVHFGIMHYIHAIYLQRFERLDEIRYCYKLPENLDEYSKFEYYELLNKARKPSFMPSIETDKYLTHRY